ncbi:MAG: indole-3-glycerol phosphate synthase TrpC [Trueperaceae bacterium]|nr:indole-3-glycerol phosphate synthase TrpC [Trueperaceae bacterium]
MRVSIPTDTPRLSQEDLADVPGVLGTIARERLADYEEAALDTANLDDLDRKGFADAIRAEEGLSVIAEIKRSSPSQGAIADLVPNEAAQAYAEGGATCLSVLTEPRHFGGDLDHLRAVSRVVSLPLLRKDFVVHPVQLFEAKQAGASAVLLIVAILGRHLRAYVELADALGLDALVEVHDEAELNTALAARASLIGVNNRDLRSLDVDLDNAPKLIGLARAQQFAGLLVAESGYRTAADLNAVRDLADAVLIGTSLAGSGDLASALRQFRDDLAQERDA